MGNNGEVHAEGDESGPVTGWPSGMASESPRGRPRPCEEDVILSEKRSHPPAPLLRMEPWCVKAAVAQRAGAAWEHALLCYVLFSRHTR